jgi:hypothetical protein
MPVVNKPNRSFHQWATDAVANVLRRERLSAKRARSVAKLVVGIAGPGPGHRNINYRISPGRGGWWMTEVVGGDAHEEPRPQTHFVPEANVKRLWRLIKKLAPASAKYRSAADWSEVPASYRFNLPEVALVLRRKKLLPRGMDTLSIGGGRRRATYYFPLYLYPMRVLDYLGRIRFGRSSWRLE